MNTLFQGIEKINTHQLGHYTIVSQFLCYQRQPWIKQIAIGIMMLSSWCLTWINLIGSINTSSPVSPDQLALTHYSLLPPPYFSINNMALDLNTSVTPKNMWKCKGEQLQKATQLQKSAQFANRMLIGIIFLLLTSYLVCNFYQEKKIGTSGYVIIR